MPLQSPVFQLDPVQPSASPVDRFQKLAQIQALVEGNQRQNVASQLDQQKLQMAQQEQKDSAEDFAKVQEAMQEAGGDMDKAIDLILQKGVKNTDYIHRLQEISNARKVSTPKPKTSLVDTVDDAGVPGQLVIDEADSVGKFFKSAPKVATPAAEPNSVREYQFYEAQEKTAGRTPKTFAEWQQAPEAKTGMGAASIQEYNLYADQEKAAGRTPLTFDKWQTVDANRKRVQPPTVVVNTVNSKGEPVIRVEPRIAGSEFAAQPTAEVRNRQAALDKISPIINSIDELSAKINTAEGVIATLSGAAEKQKARINLNDDVSEYNAVIEGFTPMLARAVGHTGVLTEQDVQSVKSAFPKVGDSKAVRDRKMSRFKSILFSGKQGQLKEVLGGGGTGGAPKADPLGIR